MNISIDGSRVTGKLRPFWQSMGFTPAALLLTEDMRQQIVYCGSIPREGIKYARIHYLLELVDLTFQGEQGRYGWERLDQGLDLLVQNGIVPIFELMGNPGGQFHDFNDPVQLDRWKNLVRELAQHLMERYGTAEVERWYFETWNEPDIGFGWSQQWPQDETSFCNYYDACVTGLDEANSRLVIGGPGTCRTLSSLFEAFLTHCDQGKNALTGQIGVRIDFISVHEKGVRAHPEDLTPRTAALIEREAQIVDHVRAAHPRFAHIPWMNNECDPQVGWKDIHTWHARPYYAAWVCKSLIQHLERLVDGMDVNYTLLSNDNGFIGTWGNRSLLTRFGASNWIEDGQGGHARLAGWAQREFDTPPFAMLKKPVFNAMVLLSLLGEERLAVHQKGKGARFAADASLDVLATRAEDGAIAVLVSYSRDQICSSGSQRVYLTFTNLPFARAALVQYALEDTGDDPYCLWEMNGAPDIPGSELLAAMRNAQEPALVEAPQRVEAIDHRLEVDLDISLQGLRLVLLLPETEGDATLPTITGLRAEPFAGLHGAEYLLRWQPLRERTLQSYLVLRSEEPGGPFVRVNQPDLLCSAYLVSEAGYYQVAAQDVWGKQGLPSETIRVG